MTRGWLLLAMCIAAHVAANLAFRGSMARLAGEPLPAALRLALADLGLWAGLALSGVVLASYLAAIRDLPAAVAYATVSGSAMLGLALGGAALYGDAISLQAALGMALILAGVLTLYFA